MSETREAQLEKALRQMADAAEMLWSVVANVSGGDWSMQTREWHEAAIRWRDNYHAALGTYLVLSTPPETTPEPPTPEPERPAQHLFDLATLSPMVRQHLLDETDFLIGAEAFHQALKPERPAERCAKCGEPAKEHGPFGFRDHAPVDANGDEIATDEPEWEGAAERCVDMGALDALLAYGHDECDSALRDQRREDYVQWSGWVDALERLKAQSGKPLSVEEDTHE